MSKGWRFAVVVLLAVAVVGAVTLKEHKSKGRGAPTENRVAATVDVAPDTASPVESDKAEPAETSLPLVAGKPEDKPKSDSAAAAKPPMEQADQAKPANLPKIAQKPAAPARPTVAPQPPPKPTSLPKLVDLGAKKCIPCKMMAPILEELKKEYKGKLVVEFVDVWENPKAAQEYGINSIPTQVFYDQQGKEFFRHVGFYSKEDILAKFTEHGIELAKGDSE
jgi:thioredoxin 1